MEENTDTSVDQAKEIKDVKEQMKNLLKRFWWVGLILVAIVVFGVIVAFFGSKNTEPNNNNELGKDINQQKNKQETNGYRDIFLTSTVYQKDAEVEFTVPPMPVDKITSIDPLGGADSGDRDSTGGGSHNIPVDHIYVHEGDKKSGQTQAYDVSAVADGYLVQVEYEKARWEANDHISRMDDYTLTFQYSKNLFLMICHLTDLSQDLKDKIGNLKESDQNFYEIPIKAGQIIGRGGGGPTIDGIDLWAVDLNKPAHFIHSKRYGTKSGNSVNPLNYFAEPLRRQLYTKLPQRPEPRGGEFAYDIDGRLVGNWFPETDKNIKKIGMPTLSFFYFNYDPSVIQIGYIPTNMVYIVKNNRPDPAAINVNSGLVKYEVMNERSTNDSRKTSNFKTEGTFLVQMLGEREIKVEFFEGKTGSQIAGFTENAQRYDR